MPLFRDPEAGVVHTVPETDEHPHDVGSFACWCVPTIERPCPECDGDGYLGNEACWACLASGWVLVNASAAPHVEAVHVLHRDAAERARG